jgi:hypothetical protein
MLVVLSAFYILLGSVVWYLLTSDNYKPRLLRSIFCGSVGAVSLAFSMWFLADPRWYYPEYLMMLAICLERRFSDGSHDFAPTDKLSQQRLHREDGSNS